MVDNGILIIIRRIANFKIASSLSSTAAGKHNYFNGRRAWKCSFICQLITASTIDKYLYMRTSGCIQVVVEKVVSTSIFRLTSNLSVERIRIILRTLRT